MNVDQFIVELRREFALAEFAAFIVGWITFDKAKSVGELGLHDSFGCGI